MDRLRRTQDACRLLIVRRRALEWLDVVSNLGVARRQLAKPAATAHRERSTPMGLAREFRLHAELRQRRLVPASERVDIRHGQQSEDEADA